MVRRDRVPAWRFHACVRAAVLLLCAAVTGCCAVHAAMAPSGERDVWIMDKRLNLPFCRIRVPTGWEVEGNVAWTYARPVMSPTMWIRLTDSETGTVFESAGPLGSFYWQESAWAAPEPGKGGGNRKDGRFDMEKNAYLLKQRSGRELLAEFVRPLVEKTTPGAKVLWIRDGSLGAARNKEDLEKRLEEGYGSFKQLREHARAAREDVTGARMLVEKGGGGCLFSTMAVVWHGGAMLMDVYSFRWEWVGVGVVAAPMGVEPEEEAHEAVFRTRVAVNPDWARGVIDLVQRQWDDYHPDNTWPLVNFDEYYAQAWESGGMLARAVDSDGNGAFDSQYAEPDSMAAAYEPRASKGYANALVEALVLGGSPFGSRIGRLEPFE